MTCHHRAVVVHLREGEPVGAPDMPSRAVDDPKRCRCQINEELRPKGSYDHCHHTADGEDMRCSVCRQQCVGPYFVVNASSEGIHGCIGEECPPQYDALREQPVYAHEEAL